MARFTTLMTAALAAAPALGATPAGFEPAAGQNLMVMFGGAMISSNGGTVEKTRTLLCVYHDRV